MAAPEGNQFWKARGRHGRRPKWEDPNELWESCCDYFEWVEDNPLHETKAFHFQGQVITEQLPKMRAMTIGGLCIFLGCSRDTWEEYRKKDGFSGVISRVDEIMRDQKFSGAAADLLNANIISRDLGLADKKDHTSSDGSMTPKATEVINNTMSADEATRIYQDMINGSDSD